MIRIVSIDTLPEDVAARARVMGFTHRAEMFASDADAEPIAGAWGRSEAGALHNLYTIREQAQAVRS